MLIPSSFTGYSNQTQDTIHCNLENISCVMRLELNAARNKRWFLCNQTLPYCCSLVPSLLGCESRCMHTRHTCTLGKYKWCKDFPQTHACSLQNLGVATAIQLLSLLLEDLENHTLTCRWFMFMTVKNLISCTWYNCSGCLSAWYKTAWI